MTGEAGSRQRRRVGVLAMQGAFAEHVHMLAGLGAEAFEVRTLEQLDRCEAIVIPGGESTAIRKALDRCGLLEPLHVRIADGLPALGTCAGMIVLADTAPDGAPACLGLLDIAVERNGWGRQLHSTEQAVAFDDGSHATGVFIRAPRITRMGKGVTTIARIAGGAHDGEAVAVRQGAMFASSYHPELAGDDRLHRMLVESIRS